MGVKSPKSGPCKMGRQKSDSPQRTGSSVACTHYTGASAWPSSTGGRSRPCPSAKSLSPSTDLTPSGTHCFTFEYIWRGSFFFSFTVKFSFSSQPQSQHRFLNCFPTTQTFENLTWCFTWCLTWCLLCRVWNVFSSSSLEMIEASTSA